MAERPCGFDSHPGHQAEENGMAGKPAAYVLKSADGKYLYKGSCRDLDRRMEDHRAGRVLHTKNRRPVMLVHAEFFETYTEARQRENFLKSGVGRAWLKAKLSEARDFPP